MVIDIKLVQFLKALSPIDITEFGIVIDVKLIQLQKAMQINTIMILNHQIHILLKNVLLINAFNLKKIILKDLMRYLFLMRYMTEH